MSNPYLLEFENIKHNFDQLTFRTSLVKKYSWAVPNQEAIDYLVSLSPIIEIGAGTGYWASLIKQSNGNIIAFDKDPYINLWCDNQWTEVLKGDHTILTNYPERTLFLCWAPYNNPLAYNCLKTYKGNKLVVVGESFGGCTANDDFFLLLQEEWKIYKEIYIPQYMGIHDYLVSYIRK